MGRAGMKGGAIHAQNIQAGSVDITTDGSGDGTATVTFPKAMKSAGKIVLTAAESDTTGTLSTSAKKNVSFIAKVDGSSVVSGTLTVDWIAFDDSYN
jgi:hypothetical protein